MPQYVNLAYKDDHFGDAVLHDPDKTNIEAFRSGLKLVREAAGKDVFLLGCCASQNMRSYGGAFGLVDAMRVGPDNGGGSWKSVLTGPRIASRHYHLNGRIWYNDPDVVYVRPSLSLDQARANASWVADHGPVVHGERRFHEAQARSAGSIEAGDARPRPTRSGRSICWKRRFRGFGW